MKYALLIYENEKFFQEASPEEKQAIMTEYFAFTEEVKEKQLLLGGEALQSIATASCVQVKQDKSIVTDGPFAETKEQLGGFYLLDCKDLDEALAYAAKIPAARVGRIEVRPIMTFDEES